MSDEYYEQLADRLGSLPNGFPRTSTGVEIRLLKKIVPPDEARLASQLTMEVEPVETIAVKFGLSVDDTMKQIRALAQRGLVRIGSKKGMRGFRLAPFIVGLYEAQLQRMDHDLAHLFDEYMLQAGARGILAPQPAIHRVIPSQKAIKTEEVLPYDDVRAILSKAKVFSVRDCICRIERSYHGHQCKFPVRICLSFSMQARAAAPNDISQADALAILEEAEEVGLVHTVANVADGWGYVCNCCSCCCGIMRGITEFGIENSVARANFFAVVDSDRCTNCQLCYDRCHVGAITERERTATVDVTKCIGCGLCVTACPDEVIRLHKKPDIDVIHPPATYEDWERARLAARSAGRQ